MREHSDEVDWGQNSRLPWEYDAATQAVGDQFMQLREQLVPYLYTLAVPGEQHRDPDDPGPVPQLSEPGRGLHQPDRVHARAPTCWSPRSPSPAPASPPRSGSRPGTWKDYFTGATFTGPGPQTINVPTSRMPVFVKEGGIVPLQPSTGQAQTAGTAPITLQVHAGANGSYSLYDDAGTGLGYQSGQSAQTPISYTENASAGTSTLTISPATGSYTGEPGQPHLHPRPGRRVAAQLRPDQRADARGLAVELQQRHRHPPGPARRRRDHARASTVTQIGGTPCSSRSRQPR